MPPIVTPMEVELAAVGRNMAGLRKAKGLRLSDLAEATGYTTSHLSQIERGASVPSLTALAMVAMALGVEMTALLDTVTGPLVHITRAGEGRELRLPGSPSFRVLGSHGVSGAYTAIVMAPPDSADQYRHYGERFALVLSGSIRISFGEEHHDLETGDTLHYAAHETHEARRTGEAPCQVLIISSPALF
ncbi:helix-turn-helix domain-containing protein [Candidatus Spongiisocius sp.]|uniref:helix-turn-helix domain-containing protein n=1 Tax=Candidatus Spongiisocius sp. TaxID=3101273 RepID=UPI003B5B4549